jgi:hypothetical protein
MERMMILLACTASGTDKLPLLLIGKSENPSLKMPKKKKVSHKYGANRKAYTIFTDYLRALDVKMSSENRKILLFTDQCAPHPKDTSYLENLNVVVFPQTASAFSNHLTRE